ncbi:phosphoribosylamine--glycine ligase [Petrotoga sp. 9PWA.NaAc.5.4]|uniref:phosphoribosylamine--glycine ligase n=1 Tax=Petrotoga sp. 9PWA.NaAc.5.4 TaxID=1434328 RepID=UPI000CACE7AE|nr:phosphoribosylamine--glycine ligase [Petrotoga sp. 9PWA.NaAc.5.4]PNR92812.1 phosphoribosylamine--glycine ligase [Petrotoga sp. 9PWA.NaAc.5.4]
MRILVIGKGGREHALAWKFAQNKNVENIFVMPGNDGISFENKCKCVNIDDIDEILDFAKKESIDITFVGSEEYLAKGIVDKFKENKLNIIGPERKAARLESSKVFAKNFMQKYGVQTADYITFDNLYETRSYIENLKNSKYPLVIKADGLAGGKGVFICNNLEESEKALNELMEKSFFKEAARKIVLERYLSGFETSLFILLDGENYNILCFSKDHKKLLEEDKGPNTGGMGAITPHPDIKEELREVIDQKIIFPTLNGLKKEGLFYKGVLYIGLLIENDEPYVLEYNVRFGDPEAQSILYLMKNDLLDIVNSLQNENINNCEIQWNNEFSLCLTICTKDYPFSYNVGEKIIIDPTITSKIFYAGVKLEDKDLVTNGGRVLNIVNSGKTLKEVREKVYRDVDKIFFKSRYYRKDI